MILWSLWAGSVALAVHQIHRIHRQKNKKLFINEGFIETLLNLYVVVWNVSITGGVQMRTITQAADQLGVSRKKIYNEIDKLNIKTVKAGKNNYIEDADYFRIKATISNTRDTEVNVQRERLENVIERDRYVTGNNISDREYTDLKEMIESLKEQLKIKDEQIKSKDNQINGLIQSNLNFARLLNPPIEEVATTVEPKKSFFSKIFK